jgi:hypothetical protein
MAAALALAASTSPSLSATKAMAAPTLARSPSLITTAARMPSLKHSTSMSALSDSTTRMGSPLLTLSPTCFSQETILPSVMVELSAGMNTSLTAFCTVRRLRERAATAFAEEAEPALQATRDDWTCIVIGAARGRGVRMRGMGAGWSAPAIASAALPSRINAHSEKRPGF